MDTSLKFRVKVLPPVKTEDLPGLSKDLQQDFDEVYLDLLSADPYTCCGVIPSHDLERELKGFRALEIDDCGEVYRLVYQITDVGNNRSVEIISFDFHDPAYDKAKDRVYKRKAVRRGYLPTALELMYWSINA